MTMSVSGTGVSEPGYPGDGSIPGTTILSPESLLAYCQAQLGDLDQQVTTQMDAQRSALAERTAVQNVETTLEGFGDQGPADGVQMQTCVAAIQNAINQLPANDPIAAKLAALGNEMVTKYGYQENPPPDPAQVATINTTNAATQAAWQKQATAAAAQGLPAPPPPLLLSLPSSTPNSLSSPPKNDDWKGTMSEFSNLADGIKSNAEIQMLTLQDLVSQRQQAVELSTGMMSKEDQTLDDGAKAIGQ